MRQQTTEAPDYLAPASGAALTHLLIVRDVDRSREFYQRVFGAKVLFDAEVGYQLTKNFLLGVGGTNLLNTFPDKLKKEANTSFGRFVYTRNVSQFDQNGAFYYAKAELTFF